MAKKKKIVKRNIVKSPIKKKPVKKSISKKTKVKKQKEPEGFKRYRKIQSIVSAYNTDHGIKVGRNIHKQAAEIYRRTKGSPIKYIKQNIDVLYTEYLQPSELKKTFPDNFPFYHFTDNLNHPELEGVIISLSFDDGIENYYFKGYPYEVDSYYKENVHSYLRKNYNQSPTARFLIEDTDQKTFVDYIIDTGTAKMEVFKQKPTEPPAKLSTEPKKPEKKPLIPEIDKEIELQKEKQKAEQEIQKTITLKISAIKELKDAGLTMAEIKKYLGI